MCPESESHVPAPPTIGAVQLQSRDSRLFVPFELAKVIPRMRLSLLTAQNSLRSVHFLYDLRPNGTYVAAEFKRSGTDRIHIHLVQNRQVNNPRADVIRAISVRIWSKLAAARTFRVHCMM